jgi:hypothetical protein
LTPAVREAAGVELPVSTRSPGSVHAGRATRPAAALRLAAPSHPSPAQRPRRLSRRLHLISVASRPPHGELLLVFSPLLDRGRAARCGLSRKSSPRAARFPSDSCMIFLGQPVAVLDRLSVSVRSGPGPICSNRLIVTSLLF